MADRKKKKVKSIRSPKRKAKTKTVLKKAFSRKLDSKIKYKRRDVNYSRVIKVNTAREREKAEAFFKGQSRTEALDFYNKYKKKLKKGQLFYVRIKTGEKKSKNGKYKEQYYSTGRWRAKTKKSFIASFDKEFADMISVLTGYLSRKGLTGIGIKGISLEVIV